MIAAVSNDQKARTKMEDGVAISVINRSSESLQTRNAIFMWFQLFIEVLLRMHHKTSDRKELMDLCKKMYEGNDEELKTIAEFEAQYKPDKAIWWLSLIHISEPTRRS